jgi:hypothetical protein
VTVYATVNDLQARYPRELTSDEEDRAAILLDDASLRLDVWVPGLAVSTDDQVLKLAKLTAIDMVLRALVTSPEAQAGVQSEGVGPFTVTYRDGNLFLYDRELEGLLALLMPNRASAVSMRSPGL